MLTDAQFIQAKIIHKFESQFIDYSFDDLLEDLEDDDNPDTEIAEMLRIKEFHDNHMAINPNDNPFMVFDVLIELSLGVP